MPKKVEGGYACNFCGEVYSRDAYAIGCENTHEITLVPFYNEDLKKLVLFIQTGNPVYLSDRLIQTILKFSHKGMK